MGCLNLKGSKSSIQNAEVMLRTLDYYANRAS